MMGALIAGRSQERSAMRRAGELGRRTEYLAFALADEKYAVQIPYVSEILKPSPITGIPRAQHIVLGIVSVRGKLITVVDLRRRFGLREGPLDRKARILLTDLGLGETIGLWVDEVLQVYRLTDEQIEPAASLGGDPPPHIAGIGRPDGELLILLDLRSLLNP